MPRVDIVIPVYNEEAALPRCIEHLTQYLDAELPWSWQVIVVDNASTDATPAVGAALAAVHQGVEYIRLEQKGRGRALRCAWSMSRADAVAYMDVDLSTDPAGLAPLLGAILSGHSEIAIGSRLAHGSRVARGLKREVISRSYNHILRLALHARFSDAQCGFKAMRTDVAQHLLPLIQDQA
jgi:glycosyltransferase involved in cell wall biosynthesis